MRRIAAVGASASLAWFVAACGAVRMEEDEWRSELLPPAEQQDAQPGERAGDGEVLRDPLRAASVLVYAIERERQGRVERWSLTLEGPPAEAPPIQSTSCRLTSEAFGESLEMRLVSPTYRGTLAVLEPDGTRTESTVDLAVGLLSQGFADLCEASSPGNADREEWMEAGMRSFACCVMLSKLGTGNEAARALVLEMIQLPSWWKWIVPVLDGTMAIDASDAEPTSTSLGPGWTLPAEFRLKGDPAFYAKLTVVPPRGALRMTGGILSGVGFAPNRPEEKVRWSLDRAYFQDTEALPEALRCELLE